MSKTSNVQADDTATPKDENPSKLVVASQVRALIKSRDFCVGGDLIEALSHRVQQIIETGILRAESNGRKTVRAGDI